jgi:hypothetical protein
MVYISEDAKLNLFYTRLLWMIEERVSTLLVFFSLMLVNYNIDHFTGMWGSDIYATKQYYPNLHGDNDIQH